MHNKPDRIRELFQLYTEDKISYEQLEEFWDLLRDEPHLSSILSEDLLSLWLHSSKNSSGIPDKVWNDKIDYLLNRLRLPKETKKISPVIKLMKLPAFRWAASVIVLLACSFFLYYLFVKKENFSAMAPTAVNINNDPAPGGNKAILTLENGQKILLDSAGNGILLSEAGTQIVKQGDGRLVYNTTGTSGVESIINTLSTPRGGQFMVTLSDGTKVWLNASSSLKYPLAFSGRERSVEITGEAYFEVAKDSRHPFVVKANQMDVRVLGTHFNINSYDDESAITTTLLEGSIQIQKGGQSNTLRPGQQAKANTTDGITVLDNVDLDEVVAWKDGKFQFENADIRSVMRQISRWYDVEVVFTGNITKHFGGTISRNVNLSQMIKMLEQTGEVKFALTGKKVIVSP